MNDNQDNLQGPASLPNNNQYQPPVPPIGVPSNPGVPPPPPPTSPVMPNPISPVAPNAPASQFSPITPNISSTPPNFSARTSSAVPPPPAPDIGIRTMASDLSSLKSTGGLEAKPNTFKPADFANVPVFRPSGTASAPGTAATAVPAHRSRLSMIIAISIAFIIVAGLVVYFFILPLISPAKNNTTTPITATTPTEQAPPVASTPVVTPQLTHQTFFITAPTSTSAVNLTTLTLGEIQTAFTAILSGVQPKTLTEINLNLNNSPVDATAFMAVAFPELDQAVIGANFYKDMTTFVYKDANGSWPGYIFKLKDPASLANVSTAVKGIESSNNLPNLFLTSPGAVKVGFKDGLTVGTTKARYITYTATGASINYVWFNNYLVVSTSFNGFKEALRLLGLPQ